MSGKEATTHRTTDWPWDVPLGLVGHRLGYPIALAFAASLILIFVAELATPRTVVITTLGLGSLAQVFDASMNGVAALNQAGRIIYANSAIGDMLGVSPESTIGTELLAYIVPEDRPQLAPFFAEVTFRRAARLAVRARRP